MAEKVVFLRSPPKNQPHGSLPTNSAQPLPVEVDELLTPDAAERLQQAYGIILRAAGQAKLRDDIPNDCEVADDVYTHDWNDNRGERHPPESAPDPAVGTLALDEPGRKVD